MKWLVTIFTSLSLLGCLQANAQDAATTERIEKLSGQIEDLITAQKTLQKQLNDLAQRLEDVREQASKPMAAYITQEDLKPLIDDIRKVDRQRIQDAEAIQKQLANIQKLAAETARAPRPAPRPTPAQDKPQKGFEYQVQSGDTLSTIIQAYRDQNVKVSLDQVLKANPGLRPEKLKVGQTIFIPAP